MPKSPELDFPASGPQQELPHELLPQPADGSMISNGNQPHTVESPFQPPASVRPQVEAMQSQSGRAYDRVDEQGQTGNIGTRERSGTTTPEDEDVLIGRAAKNVVAKMTERKPRGRRGMGPRQLLSADGPPPGVDDARRTY